MFMKHETYPAELLSLVATANEAVRQIPPLFPLEASVAVNPFLGQVQEPLAVTAARLARVAGVPVFPDRAMRAAQVDSGQITDIDLTEALAAQPAFGPLTLAEVKAALNVTPAAPVALPTVADLAAEVSGIDWPGLIDDRIGHWAASHFDRGQALWQPGRAGGVYAAWRAYAMRDLTPEIQGLAGFGAFVAATPASPWRAMGRAVEGLGITPAATPTALHRLLMSLGGWAQYARHLLWQAKLGGDTDPTTIELLTIRLVFEEALFHQYRDQIAARWADVIASHEQPVTPSRDQQIDAILQEAAERAEQRRLADTLAAAMPRAQPDRPALQAAFCIDVRSEVFRRALEAQDAGIQTIGFAGFFGLATLHHGAGSDVGESRGPVLLTPGVSSSSAEPKATDLDRRYKARAKRAWGRFKLAAVSSFAFVEATGPVYAGKLLRDTLALGGAGGKPDPMPELDPSIDLPTRVKTAAAILRAMSLTSGFAPVVLLAGHGASVTNNPHESALHCGACGGHKGDVNARLLAGLLNDPNLRKGLAGEGIEIPADTVFIGALHDTTTDAVTLFDGDLPKAGHRPDLAPLRRWLAAAGRQARTERAARLPRARGEGDVLRRAADWSEVRPEWGLAGCRAFIAAPRGRTDGTGLDGRAFLHSYDWQQDDEFRVLELILTAPVVVASWISLQYYGSTVAPQAFGGGNKLLHNVVGGIGVLEGNGGAPRPGLPWQSVHDGEGFQHDPLRLSVVVEAPREAISAILTRNPQVRALFDNGWLHLLTMGDDGRPDWRYVPGGSWAPMPDRDDARPAMAAE
ncbi:YbcC family protein [Marivivens marinus]|uniref:YbcC family protein n=1 Tax=Marivivens marinus TaxID=3110173 RepID=UPI003B845902